MPLGVRQRVRRTGADGAGPTEITRALGTRPQHRREVRGHGGPVACAATGTREGEARDRPAHGMGPRGALRRPLGSAKAAPYGEADLRQARRGRGLRRVLRDGPRVRAGSGAGAAAVARRWPPRARLGAGDHAGRLRQLRRHSRGQEPRARDARARAPRSRSRRCVATGCEKAECFCEGLAGVLGLVGRVPRVMVPGDATEAGRMPFGKVTESRLFSRPRAHYRLGSRFRDPHSGNEKGFVEYTSPTAITPPQTARSAGQLSHEVYSLAVVPVVVSPACQQAAQGHRTRVVCLVGTERRTNGGSASHATSGDCRTAQEEGDWMEEFDHVDAG